MDTEYQRLRTYNSYSEYKQICQKHLQTVGGDETKIVELFDVLNEDPENDVYLLKVNAVLDCSSSGSVQKVVTDETGRTVRTVIARATRCLENFNPDLGCDGDGPPSHLSSSAVTSAVRLLLYVYTRLERPLDAGGTPLSKEMLDPKALVDTLGGLTTDPRCPLETALLAGSVAATVIALHSHSDEGCLQEFSSILSDSTNHLLTISYLSGILTTTKSVILMGQEKSCNVLFIFSLLENIKDLCAKSTRYDFHSFLLLRQWCSRCLEISKQIKSESENTYTLDIKQEFLQEVVEICRNNFENPIKGVSELCLESYSNILEISSLCLAPEETRMLEDSLLEQTLGLSWSHKTKYLQLSALVNRLGVARVLSDQGKMAEELSQCLSSPHLVHAGTELYLKIIRNIEADSWPQMFGPVLIRALLGENPGVRLACLEQWLPASIHHVQGSQLYITGELRGVKTGPALVGLLTVFKICKNKGIEIQQEGLDMDELIKECLLHSDTSIRSAAFGLVCHAKKKGSVPSSQDLELVLQFLSRAGSDSNAKFRQNIQSSFSVLAARCRDCAALLVRNKNRQRDVNISQLEEITEFLDKCLKVLLSNLLPGGNYQRKIFSLDLLSVLINNFYNFQSGLGANKKSGNGDPTDFVRIANENGKMCFFEDGIFKILALNLEDHMSDVKEKVFEILNLFSPSEEIISELFLVMKTLINSSKEGICESGALIAKLLCNWNRKSKVVKEWDSVCDFLLSSFKSTVEKCRVNFLDCARNSPLYGIILSLRKCLLDETSAERLTFTQEKLKSLISTLEETSEMMLTVLCGEITGEKMSKNPDFQEMAQAINSLLSGCEGYTEAGEEEALAIPEEHRLVLSAAWHSLKEAVLLTGHLIHHLELRLHPSQDSCGSLSLSDTERCCRLLRTVVSLCRHKGVIEASSIASGLIASSLLASDIEDFHSLPKAMLEEMFSQLESSWSQSSFTRRGAGLPGLVQRFVASESSSRPRHLLPFAIQRLTEIARGPAGEAETEDSPCSHSLHVLRGLVQDAQIARELGPFITQITASCLQTFSSTSWSVRNAGLQLFGALAPRIVGQKKMKEDSESYNIVSLMEIVARFPGLIQLLLDKLSSSTQPVNCIVEPSVVPILTLLARMESRQESELAEQVSIVVESFSSSPVMTVRKLVAVIISQFKPRDPVELLAEILQKYLDGKVGSTNNQHFDLLLLAEIMRRREVTALEETMESLSKIDEFLHCSVLKIEVIKMLTFLQEKSDKSFTVFLNSQYIFEPGFHQWRSMIVKQRDSVQTIEAAFESFEEAEERVEAVTKSSDNIEEAIHLVTKLLEHPDSSICSGHLMDKMLDFFLTEDVTTKLNPEFNNQLFNSETAMEILDVLEDQKFKSKSFGSSVQDKVTVLAARCLNIMLIQEDWEWFFGDTSEYVSKVVENSENILALTAPENIETSRIAAAKAILSYLPFFKLSRLEKKVLILQFGFVNILNSCLTLLQDEDADVRDIVITFSSQLPRPSWSCKYSSVCLEECVRLVVWYGLDQARQVVEMFSPVLELLILPSQLQSACLPSQNSQNNSGLFRRGEGVNVFSEHSYRLRIYLDAFDVFLTQHSDYKFDLRLNIENILEFGQRLLSRMKEDKEVFTVTKSKQCFEIVTSFESLIHLVTKYDITKTSVDKEGIQTLASSLKELSLWNVF